MGIDHMVRRFFEPEMFFSPRHPTQQYRPHTARNQRHQSGPQRAAPERSIYDLSQQHSHEQQIKRAYALAMDQLRSYGFGDEKECALVLRETGPTNIKAAIRLLMERERAASAARAAADATFSSSSDGSEASSGGSFSSSSSMATSASATSSVSTPVNHSDEEMSEEEEEESQKEEKEAHPQVSLSPRDTAEVSQCRAKTEEVEREAHRLEDAAVAGAVLEQQPRECKMLRGVPVDLIGYEESLLRLQMGLDAIQVTDSVSEEGRAEVRHLRRQAVLAIQARLDKIDATRNWWLAQCTHSNEVAAELRPATAVAVA